MYIFLRTSDSRNKLHLFNIVLSQNVQEMTIKSNEGIKLESIISFRLCENIILLIVLVS